MLHLQSHKIDFKINKNDGVGIKFLDREGNKCVTIPTERCAKLEISSYVGMSIGAIHTYGTIKVNDVAFKVLEKKSKESTRKRGSVYTYGGDELPKEAQGMNIEVTRPVTKEDKEIDNGRAFECWRVGDPTDRFVSEEDLIIAVKKFFGKVFGKGWKLKIKKDKKKKDKLGEYWQEYWVTIKTNR